MTKIEIFKGAVSLAIDGLAEIYPAYPIEHELQIFDDSIKLILYVDKVDKTTLKQISSTLIRLCEEGIKLRLTQFGFNVTPNNTSLGTVFYWCSPVRML